MQLNRKKLRETVLKVHGYNIFKDKVDPLEQRASLKAELEDCTENNIIAIFENGMDCDCVKYSRTYHKKALGVMEYIKYRNDTQDWADGPVSVGYGKPSEHPIESYSRDLAAEAYENGHPHVVYI